MNDYHTQQRQAWLKSIQSNDIAADIAGVIMMAACIILLNFI